MDVVLEMDEGWRWWPSTPEHWSYSERHASERLNKIEMTEEFYANYQRLHREWYDLQQELEHMYRHQQGYTPWIESPYAVVEPVTNA